MDPKLLRFYKKKLYGGRSIAARLTDFIMIRALLLFFIFVIVLYLSLSSVVSLIISVFLTAAISLAMTAYNKRKVEKYIVRDMLRIKQKCLLEKLTFMSADEYTQYINKLLRGKIDNITLTEDGFTGNYEGKTIYAFHSHPSSECGIQDVLKVIRSFGSEREIIMLSLSKFSTEAKKMCLSLPYKVELAEGKRILELADKMHMLPDEEEAEKNAVKEMNDAAVTLDELKSSAFSKAKIKGYIICGVIIMCWPLISGFRIYYPIIAILCFAMALLTYRRSKSDAKESSDTGIC